MKEKKAITFGPMTRIGSINSSIDGELMESINVITSSGEITPIIPPKKIAKLDGTLLGIHKPSIGIETFICKTDTEIIFYKRDNDQFIRYALVVPIGNNPIDNTNGDYISHSILGNTLIFSLSKVGLFYVLFKDMEYIALGSAFPELEINFTLNGEFRSNPNRKLPNTLHINDPGEIDKEASFNLEYYSPNGEITIERIPDDESFNQHGHLETTAESSEAVIAYINSHINRAKEDNKFVFPFFIRYAYRLYEGTTTMVSAPILMNASMATPPYLFIKNKYITSSIDFTELVYKEGFIPVWVQSYLYDIHIQCEKNVAQKFGNWKDIIKSVDIFISSPITSLDQNGKIKGLSMLSYYKKDIGLFSKTVNEQDPESYPPIKATAKTTYLWDQINNEYFYPQFQKQPKVGAYPNNGLNHIFTIHVPRVPIEQINEQIKKCALFYLVSSIPIDDIIALSNLPLKDTFSRLELKDGVLNSLEVQEILKDEYTNHTTVIPNILYSYNQRLNIADYKRRYYNGHSLYSMGQYNNASDKYNTDTLFVAPVTYTHDVYVYIRDNGRELIVNHRFYDKLHYDIDQYKSHGLFEIPNYLYYPSTKAYKMVIIKKRMPGVTYPTPNTPESGIFTTPVYIELELTPHSYLNGSYHFNNFKGYQWKDATNIEIIPTTDNYSYENNKISLSDVNNPFVFPLENTNTISNGNIIGMASTTKALSQGQFGQHPLYLFTTEGIWALNISDQGTYSFKQVVTRDIAVSSKSITQTDIATIFASANGLIMLLGSDSINLSESIDGAPLNITSLPLFNSAGFDKAFDDLGFLDYIKNAIMAYDYILNRIWIVNTDKDYQYIYDTKTKSFTKIFGRRYINSVNAYPDTLLQDNLGNIYSLMQTDMPYNHPNKIKGIAVTRPIKFNNITALKRIDRMINKSDLSLDASVKVMVYGSRNGNKYHRLSSLRSTPFNYYIFVYYFDMYAKDRLSLTVCDIDLRYENKMR